MIDEAGITVAKENREQRIHVGQIDTHRDTGSVLTPLLCHVRRKDGNQLGPNITEPSSVVEVRHVSEQNAASIFRVKYGASIIFRNIGSLLLEYK
jgi:hypothetical protein